LKSFLALLEKIGRVAEDAALVVLLGSMVVMAVVQIVLRQFFDSGISWADELVKIIVLWLAMVGSIAAARDNRHIRIDVLSHVLPGKLVLLSRIVVDLFAAAVCGIIAWQAWRYLQVEIEWQETVLNECKAAGDFPYTIWLKGVCFNLAGLSLESWLGFFRLTGALLLFASGYTDTVDRPFCWPLKIIVQVFHHNCLLSIDFEGNLSSF